MQSVVSRTALERLLSSQQLLYTWTPGLAAALAAPETGGRGVAALLGTGPTLVVDGAPHRCRQRVEEAVNSSMEELLPLVSTPRPVQCLPILCRGFFCGGCLRPACSCG